MIKINCIICEKELQKTEEKLCQSCLTFVKWKYGSLEEYEETILKEIGRSKE